MSDEEEKPPFAAALRFLTERERRLLAEHPEPRDLAAYHAGDLSPEAEARLREHLALCRDCSDLLLDLAGFKKLTPPPGVPELTDEEMEKDWQAVRAKMGEEIPIEPTKVAEVVPIRPAAPAPTRDPEYGVLPWKLAAAALAIVSVALALWVMALTGRQGGPIAVFDSGEVLRGSENLPQMFSNQPGAFRFHSDERVPEYAGEIVEFGGNEVVWETELQATEIAETEKGIVSFMVPAGVLKPGKYTARLVGITEGGRGTLASLSFQVNGP